MTFSSERKALAVLIFGACTIGLAAILVRLTHTGPAAAGFWRLVLALPLLAGLLAAERRRGGAVAATSPKVMLLAGVMFAADLLCWHYSLHLTSVANSTVLSNLTPVVITAFVWVVFKEKPSRLFLAGLALAVCGAGTMAAAEGGHAGGTNPHLGDGLAILTTVWYGSYFLCVRAARKTASTLTVMLWSGLAGAPLLLIAAFLLHEPILPTLAVGWLACAGLGVVHVVGQGAIAWALGKLPAALTAVVVLVQPVVVGALGWMILGEPISWLQGLGAAVTLVGIVLAQLSTRASAAVVETG